MIAGTTSQVIRQMTDEQLEDAWRTLSALDLARYPTACRFEAEMRRRAEIRLARQELGEFHDAAGYESRPTAYDEEIHEAHLRLGFKSGGCDLCQK